MNQPIQKRFILFVSPKTKLFLRLLILLTFGLSTGFVACSSGVDSVDARKASSNIPDEVLRRYAAVTVEINILQQQAQQLKEKSTVESLQENQLKVQNVMRMIIEKSGFTEKQLKEIGILLKKDPEAMKKVQKMAADIARRMPPPPQKP